MKRSLSHFFYVAIMTTAISFAEEVKAPEWLPPYPDAKIIEESHQKEGDITTGSIYFSTPDNIKKISDFFVAKLKTLKFEVVVNPTEEEGVLQAIGIIGKSLDGKKNCNIAIALRLPVTEVYITYTFNEAPPAPETPATPPVPEKPTKP